jgi:hypothetical protein
MGEADAIETPCRGRRTAGVESARLAGAGELRQ